MSKPVPATPERLELGQKQERPLAEKETHPYLVRLEVGEYVRVAADQRGVDLTLRLMAPGGALIAEVDNLKGIQGAERVSEVATEAGDYRVDVVGNEGTPTGLYEVRIDERHAATEADRSRVVGERLFLEGEKLCCGDKDEESIESYKQALALFRDVGDRRDQAITLKSLGLVLLKAGNRAEAQACFSEALALFLSVGDAQGGAMATLHMGRVALAEGDAGRGLDLGKAALAGFEQIGDRHGLSTAHYVIAQALLKLDDPDQALQEIEASLSLAGHRTADTARLDLRASDLAARQHRLERVL